MILHPRRIVIFGGIDATAPRLTTFSLQRTSSGGPGGVTSVFQNDIHPLDVAVCHRVGDARSGSLCDAQFLNAPAPTENDSEENHKEQAPSVNRRLRPSVSRVSSMHQYVWCAWCRGGHHDGNEYAFALVVTVSAGAALLETLLSSRPTRLRTRPHKPV